MISESNKNTSCYDTYMDSLQKGSNLYGRFFWSCFKTELYAGSVFGVDYHSHLGTRRGGMAVYEKGRGFARSIHNIENSPFRTKFDSDLDELTGTMGIGCISDSDPQPC